MLFSSCFTQIINLCKIGKQTNLIKQIFLFQILHFIFFFYTKLFFSLTTTWNTFYRFTQNIIFFYFDNCYIININLWWINYLICTCFISNNDKGIQVISKWIKILEHLKNYVTSNIFIFLQETHSSVKDDKVRSDEFKGQLFFSHG